MPNLRVLLLSCAPIGLVALYLLLESWLRQRRGERRPVRDKLFRPAGHSLQCEIEKGHDRITLYVMIAAVCSLSFAFMQPGNAAQDVRLFITFGLAATGSVALILFEAPRLRFRHLGLLGELVMGQELQALSEKGYRIFNDIPGGGKWNVDHVAVGQGGVFAIETKCRMKKPSRNELEEHQASLKGEALRFPGCEDKKVIRQARRNAKWLGKVLSESTAERVRAQPVVALPGWFVLPHDEIDVKVLSGKQVADYIAAQPRTLSPETIQRIAFQLEQRCRDVEF